MNAWFTAGAALGFLIGGAHSWLGERYIIRRLVRRSDLPSVFGNDVFTKRTIRFAWHITTIAWWGLAGILLDAGSAGHAQPVGSVVRIVAITFLASSIVAVIGSRGRHLSWVVFLAIALAAWLGLRS